MKGIEGQRTERGGRNSEKGNKENKIDVKRKEGEEWRKGWKMVEKLMN